MPPLTFAVDTTTTGNTTYETGETADFPTGADDLTVNSGVTVSVTAGNLSMAAGDDLILQSGSQVTASGSVLLAIGSNVGDLDGIGAINSEGLVQATSVTFVGFQGIRAGRVVATAQAILNEPNGAILDSNTTGADITAPSVGLIGASGIGTSADRLETQASNLEAHATDAGVFLSNTGNVMIGGIGTGGTLTGLVALTSGDISLVNAGSIVLIDIDAPEIVKSGNISGSVSLAANGANADFSVAVDNKAITAAAGSIDVTAGRDILLGTAGDFDNDVRANFSVFLTAGRHVRIDGKAEVVSDFLDGGTGGDVIITAGTAGGGDIILDNDTGSGARVRANSGGDVVLTTGADSFLILKAPDSGAVVSTASGDVTANADRVTIHPASGITAVTGLVTIRPVSVGRAIDLGSLTDAAANTLELSDAELDGITATDLHIGSFGNAGPVTFTASINPANLTDDMTVQSGAGITVNAGVAVQSPGDLTLQAGGDVMLLAGASLSATGHVLIFVDSPDSDAGVGNSVDLRNGTITAGGRITVTGNVDRDALFGGAAGESFIALGGDDDVRGGGGNDRLHGGLGNDRLSGDAGADTLIGSRGNDVVLGGADGDRLFGEAGNDLLLAGLGNDRLDGGADNDRLLGDAGTDTLIGGLGNDRLDGGTGNDNLVAGAGNDVLRGNVGFDTLFGGTGGDTFEFLATSEAAGRIQDFNFGQGDRIRLTAIDADLTAAGNQAFTFIGAGAFTDAGQLRFTTGGGETRILLNTDADAAAEAVIQVRGIHIVTASWFGL
jgi:serralysin